MSNRVQRLVLAAGMIALLLLALAYWWLDNLPHEVFGTAMFVLLGRHLYVNRRWLSGLVRGRLPKKQRISTALHVLLLLNMIVLLGTSIVISRSVFSFLPLPDSVPTRDLHWFSAYWVMILVGIHAWLHWGRVMSMTRVSLGLSGDSPQRTWTLRVLTLALAATGVWSIPVLNVWTKLTFNFSMDIWDFNASVAPFFLRWFSVAALPAIVVHYGWAWMKYERGGGASYLENAAVSRPKDRH